MEHPKLIPGPPHGPSRMEAGSREHSLARFELVDRSESAEGSPSDAKSLLEYWEVLTRRKGTIFLAALLCAALGFWLGLVQTPLYLAKTTLEIQDFNENFLDIRNVTPTAAGNSMLGTYMVTQAQILRSNTLMERVVEKLRLHEQPEFQPGAPRDPPAWQEALDLPQPEPLSARERARRSLQGSLQVVPSVNSRILEISFEWTDPEFAAKVLNTLAQEYIQQNMEARWQSSQQTGEWLEKQLEEHRVKLQESERELQRYARDTGLMFTQERNSVAEDKLRQLQSALSAAQADRVAKQSQYETAVSSPIESLPDILNDASLREHQMRLANLKTELAQLRTSFKPTYPKVKQIEAQIAEVEATLERERTKIIERIKSEYEAARRREKLLAAEYSSQTGLVAEQSAKSIHYNILRQEVDSNRQLYDSMLQRLREAGVASALRATSIRVLDAAEPPAAPYKPSLFLNSVIGGFVGMFLGVIAAFMLNSTDRSLRIPGDANRWLRLPELGVIPARDSIPMRRTLKLLPGGGASRSSRLSVFHRRKNGDYRSQWAPLAEYFRVTLTSILLSGRNGDRPKVMVVTSPGPGEGKTSVASNLAMALAEMNQQVLLIDADMRKPRVHEIFSLPNTWGLSDLLRGEIPIDGCPLEAFARQTEIPGLYVLPSGPAARNVARLLYSAAGQRLFQRLREEFNAVIIDTPPMLQISDARLMGQMADGVILVLRAGHTTRESAKAAKERLFEDGTRVLGTVLNGWNPKAYGYGSYDNYDSYRRYYEEVAEGRQQTL